MSLDKSKLTENYKNPNYKRKGDKEAYAKLLKSMEKSFADIGVYIKEEGVRKTKSGAPRFYEMTPTGRFKDALENGLDIKSEAFLDKLLKGNVFTFPAGEKKPVQITCVSNALYFSKPLDRIIPDPPKEPVKPQMPEKPVKPAPLSGWKRFLNTITFGGAYKKDVADFKEKTEQYTKDEEQWEKDFKKYEDDLDQYDEDLKEYNKEKEKYEGLESTQKDFDELKALRTDEEINAEKDREREEEQKQFQAVSNKENFASSLDAKLDAISNFYRPKPEQDLENTAAPGTEVKSGKTYSQEQFDKLTEINIEGFKIGGKQITDDQFASLAMCAAMLPQYGGHVGLDGYSEGKATPEQMTVLRNTHYTCDLAQDKNPDGTYRPRENSGRYFETAIQPGRLYAVQALVEHKMGRPEKLGQLIAYAAELQFTKSAHETIRQPQTLLNDVMVSRTLDLLMSDADLLSAAKNAGLTGEEINAMKGAQMVADVWRENERAQKLLDLNNKVNQVQGLSENERAECIKARLSFESIEKNLQDKNRELQKSEGYDKCKKTLENNITEVLQKPLPPRGSNESALEYQERIENIKNIRINDASLKFDLYRNTGAGLPEIYEMVGKHGEKTIQMLSEKYLPGQDKIMKLKGKELQETLSSEKMFDKGSPYSTPKQTEQVKQKTVERTRVQDKSFG